MNPVGNIKKQSIREIVKSEKWISDVKKAKSGTCPKCWTNCYALVSEMTYPEKAIIKYIRTKTG